MVSENGYNVAKKTKKKNFFCGDCGLFFQNESDYVGHTEMVHPNQDSGTSIILSFFLLVNFLLLMISSLTKIKRFVHAVVLSAILHNLKI